MPAAPELGNACRTIRRVKVLRKTKAHHAGKANGHIGITRKIKVNLKSIGNNSNPSFIKTQCLEVAAHIEVCLLCKNICNEHFFGQTQTETKQTNEAVVWGFGSVYHLSCNAFKADNWTRNGVRKNEFVKQVMIGALKRRVFIAVHLNSISKRLKRKERDADWQSHLRPGQLLYPKRAQRCIDIFNKEVGVFKIS